MRFNNRSYFFKFRRGSALLVLSALLSFATSSYGQSVPSKPNSLRPILETGAVKGNPFKIKLTKTAGFDIWPGSNETSAMLTDGSFENGDPERQPTLLIISSDSQNDEGLPDDIELFAAVMLHAADDLFKKARIEDTDILKIAGMSAAQTSGKAKGFRSGEKVRFIQWMLFSPDGRFVRLIGYAPKADFDEALPRFHLVRDSMEISG